MDWYDYVRIATAILGSIASFKLFVRCKERWSEYTSYLRELIWVLQALLLLMIERNIEKVFSDVPLESGTLTSFVIAVYALTTMMKDQEFLKDTPFRKLTKQERDSNG